MSCVQKQNKEIVATLNLIGLKRHTYKISIKASKWLYPALNMERKKLSSSSCLGFITVTLMFLNAANIILTRSQNSLDAIEY